MSVPIIENWAFILGEVIDISQSEEIQGFEQVLILVERIETVDDYPNLVAVYLEESPQAHLPVLMPEEIISEVHLHTGAIVECRVRRAGLDRMFVHRDYIEVIAPE